MNQDSYTPVGKSKVAVLIDSGGIVATYTKTRLVPSGSTYRSASNWAG